MTNITFLILELNPRSVIELWLKTIFLFYLNIKKIRKFLFYLFFSFNPHGLQPVFRTKTYVYVYRYTYMYISFYNLLVYQLFIYVGSKLFGSVHISILIYLSIYLSILTCFYLLLLVYTYVYHTIHSNDTLSYLSIYLSIYLSMSTQTEDLYISWFL